MGDAAEQVNGGHPPPTDAVDSSRDRGIDLLMYSPTEQPDFVLSSQTSARGWAILPLAPSGLPLLAARTRPFAILTHAATVPELRESQSPASWAPLVAICDHFDASTSAFEAGADVCVLRTDVSALGPQLPFLRRLCLERSRSRLLEQALDAVSDAVEIHDREAHLLWANQAFEAMSGHAPRDMLGRAPREVMRSPQRTRDLDDAINHALTSGEPWRGSMVGIRRDGHAVEQLVSLHPVATVGAEGSFSITQFLIPALHGANSQAETASGIAALVSSEQRFRTMMEAAGDAILIHDFESARAIDVNPAACKLFGYDRSEFLKLTGASLGGPESAEHTRRMSASLRATGHGHEPRHPMRRKDGSRFVADVRITIYEFFGRKQYLVIVRDVTEQVEREQALEQSNKELSEAREQLLHSARLAALGQMAASVAHEVNNPLQYMSGGIQLLRERLPESVENQEAISILDEGIDRIRNVTRALLPFSRVEPAREENLKLTEVVDSVWKMTSTLIRHRAKFEVDIPATLSIKADRTRLAQLITNLVTNAAHAIDEGHAEKNLILVRAIVDASRLTLSVSDTGRGIPLDHQPHIFDPFFTTKTRELGTGLGLSLCQEIARQHDGTLRFVTEVGVGTTFFLELPRQRVEAAQLKTATAVETKRLKARVLIIDDEALVAESFRMFLKGCSVDVANGGEEGLEFLAEDDSYDVILCDLMMPGMDGPTVYESIRARWPGLERRMLFCSGGAFTPKARSFLAATTVRLLDKPVSPRDLTSAVAEVMAFHPR